MSKTDNLISIIIPVFNRINIIKETLESIKNQSYTNWELVLIDDGSTDGTYEHLHEIAEVDKRFILHRREKLPKGASTCRNIGIDISKGQYVMFIDSDDILVQDCLEERVRNFSENSDCDFLIFPALIFTKHPGDSDILWNIDKGTDDIQRFLDLDVPWQTSASIWTKDALLKLGYWDDKTSAWEDMDFHIRALISGFKYKKINSKPDYFYRIANADKLSRNDKTIPQLFTRIFLIENIVGYLKTNDLFKEPYISKVIKFYMWICLSFIKLKHIEGVNAICNSLYRMEIYSWFFSRITKIVMKINLYFFHTTFNKLIFTLGRNIWKITLFRYYFDDLPPKNCTVKTLHYKAQALRKFNI